MYVHVCMYVCMYSMHGQIGAMKQKKQKDSSLAVGIDSGR